MSSINKKNPCFDCLSTPCCTMLPVFSPEINSRSDLEQIALLLQMDGFSIGLYDSGKWMVYSKRLCRHFDSGSGLCSIHGQTQRPEICGLYSSKDCWYTSELANGLSLRFIHLDYQRLLWLMNSCSYDYSGEIAGVPDWDQMLSVFQEELPFCGTAKIAHMHKEKVLLSFPLSLTASDTWVDRVKFRLCFSGVSLALEGGCVSLLLAGLKPKDLLALPENIPYLKRNNPVQVVSYLEFLTFEQFYHKNRQLFDIKTITDYFFSFFPEKPDPGAPELVS
ncbi:MAG: YkgJ family cysteine cluster protein [Spirochaetia bacterium]